ncbi:MAG: FG-GAP repeat domain-containing protein [Planctomycetota bacterium]|jgi:hypothetical protein
MQPLADKNSVPGVHPLLRGVCAAVALAIFAPSAFAQLQFDELRKRHLPPDQDSTVYVAVGDVDGDSDLDLIVGNYESQNRLYINNGDFTFTDATVGNLPVESDKTINLALEDVDGDGDLDLAVGNGGSSGGKFANRLYVNDGNGKFTDVSSTQLPGHVDCTGEIILTDVDGDGDRDLIAATYHGQSRLSLNDSNGFFSDFTSTGMPIASYGTQSMTAGDVDGDGDPDLILGNEFTQNRLYRNNGSGIFADDTAGNMPSDSYDTGMILLGDVNGDAYPDMVLANGQFFVEPNLLYLNDGSGLFTKAPAGDLPPGSDTTYGLALGDLDADGDLDLITGNTGVPGWPQISHRNRMYLNDGLGVFTDVSDSCMPADSENTWHLALADLDGDGFPDLIAGNGFIDNGQPNRMYRNDGSGVFADATASHIVTEAVGTIPVVLSDVDGDGDPDLIMGTTEFGGTGGSPQQNRLYMNDGSGNFSDATDSSLPTKNDRTMSVHLKDMDADGDPDLVCGSYSGQNQMLLNDGNGIFSDATSTCMPVDNDSTFALAVGDVDGDGHPDIFCGNGGVSAQQNRMYINNGSGVFSDETAACLPTSNDWTWGVALGDVDADGDLDAVVGNEGLNMLYLNDGFGVFSDATASNFPLQFGSYTRAVALGDVDGDKDLDAVFITDSQANLLYLNNGKGFFSDHSVANLPWPALERSFSVALSDVDEDGDPDLVIGNGVVGRPAKNVLLLNDGSGVFTDASNRLPPDFNATFGLTLGDVDKDGDTDLIAGNFEDGQTRVYFNLLRHVDSPYLPKLASDYHLDAYARYGPPRLVDVVFPFVSTARANIPFPPFGTIGIDLVGARLLPPVLIPQPAGVESMTTPVPDDASLIGVSVHSQAVLVPYPWFPRLTNVTADQIKY